MPMIMKHARPAQIMRGLKTLKVKKVKKGEEKVKKGEEKVKIR